jgi:hypothetical protein
VTDDDPVNHAERAKVVARYEQLGPVWWRLFTLGKAVAVVVVWIILSLLFATAGSLHRGTGVNSVSDPERPAVARVDSCTRVGPVSADGFGFYDGCRVTVTVEGRVVHTTVRGSVVTSADIGRDVEFRESCADKGKDLDDCRYGRAVGWPWGVLLSLLTMLRVVLTLVLIAGVLIYLASAVLGPRKYYAKVDARRNRSAAPDEGKS